MAVRLSWRAAVLLLLSDLLSLRDNDLVLAPAKQVLDFFLGLLLSPRDELDGQAV